MTRGEPEAKTHLDKCMRMVRNSDALLPMRPASYGFLRHLLALGFPIFVQAAEATGEGQTPSGLDTAGATIKQAGQLEGIGAGERHKHDWNLEEQRQLDLFHDVVHASAQSAPTDSTPASTVAGRLENSARLTKRGSLVSRPAQDSAPSPSLHPTARLLHRTGFPPPFGRARPALGQPVPAAALRWPLPGRAPLGARCARPAPARRLRVVAAPG